MRRGLDENPTKLWSALSLTSNYTQKQATQYWGDYSRCIPAQYSLPLINC